MKGWKMYYYNPDYYNDLPIARLSDETEDPAKEAMELILRVSKSAVVRPESRLFMRPKDSKGVTKENGIIKLDANNILVYDVFDYYQPNISTIPQGLVEKTVHEYFTPHRLFAEGEPLEFCGRYGLPKGEFQISVDDYLWEQRQYKLFTMLIGCLQQGDYDKATDLISEFNLGEDFTPENKISFVKRTITELSDKGTEGTKVYGPAWNFPNLLSALYTIVWFECQQGKISLCRNCGKSTYKKRKYCSEICSRRYHSRKSMAKKRKEAKQK